MRYRGVVKDNELTAKVNLPDGPCRIQVEDSGTENQNRTFHGIILEYCRVFGDDPGTMKNKIKLNVKGAKKYLYVDDYGRIVSCARRELIPEDLLVRAYVITHSWADFTRHERGRSIDELIKICNNAGLNSKKYDAILTDYFRG
jgi:hypothetical protein